ncbi:MAG TPA: cytochrome P450, partial [Vampirovibrionales bacterium]
MVSNPQAIEKMLTSEALTAPGAANEIVRPLVGDNSLILLSGSQHQQRRKLLMPTFHGERMRNYGQLIGAIAEQVSRAWITNQPFIMESAMQEITMRVILQAVFGLSEGPRLEQLRECLVERLNLRKTLLGSSMIFFPFLGRNWGSWSPGAKVIEKQKRVDDLIYSEIRDRRANPDPNRTDILNLLLSAHDESGEGLTDIELRDELITLLVAGHETTASALSWAFYWIHQIPSIRDKLLSELDALGENPDPLEIFRLPYLTAVCQETLRIYPVAILTFTRQVQAPVEIRGHSFEPGVKMVGSIYLTHRREDLYPEPHLFKPERFLARQFSLYEY